MPTIRLQPDRAAILLIDLQEKLVPVMRDRKTLTRRCARLVQGAHLLGVPLLVTEQYPRGLGETVSEVARHFVNPHCIESKTRFSACITPIQGQLESLNVETVVLAGVEAHVCVLGTCLDLLDAGYKVMVAHDAISSRRSCDMRAAVQRMTQAGAVPTTVETVLMELVGDASAPAFREVRHLITAMDE